MINFTHNPFFIFVIVLFVSRFQAVWEDPMKEGNKQNVICISVGKSIGGDGVYLLRSPIEPHAIYGCIRLRVWVRNSTPFAIATKAIIYYARGIDVLFSLCSVSAFNVHVSLFVHNPDFAISQSPNPDPAHFPLHLLLFLWNAWPCWAMLNHAEPCWTMLNCEEEEAGKEEKKTTTCSRLLYPDCFSR